MYWPHAPGGGRRRTNCLRVYISLSRQKVELDLDDPGILLTEMDIGYRIVDEQSFLLTILRAVNVSLFGNMKIVMNWRVLFAGIHFLEPL